MLGAKGDFAPSLECIVQTSPVAHFCSVLARFARVVSGFAFLQSILHSYICTYIVLHLEPRSRAIPSHITNSMYAV